VRTSNFGGKHSHRSISVCQKQLGYFKFCKVLWRHYLGQVGKFLSYFVANLSTTLRINFNQNWSSIAEIMTKNFGVFLCPTVYFHRL